MGLKGANHQVHSIICQKVFSIYPNLKIKCSVVRPVPFIGLFIVQTSQSSEQFNFCSYLAELINLKLFGYITLAFIPADQNKVLNV